LPSSRRDQKQGGIPSGLIEEGGKAMTEKPGGAIPPWPVPEREGTTLGGGKKASFAGGEASRRNLGSAEREEGHLL